MPDQPQSGWTLETLKEHLESRIEAQKEAISVGMAAADRAVSKAETAAEKRFESVNEFRNTLSDQQRNLMPRTEAETKFGALEKELTRLREDQLEARSKGEGAYKLWFVLAGIVMLAVSIAARFWK